MKSTFGSQEGTFMTPIKLKIIMDLPHPSPSPNLKKSSVEEKIKDAMCLCESGHESGEEWELLRKVYNLLGKKKKLNKRQKRVLDLLHPFMMKHQSASGGDLNPNPELVNLFEED